MSEEPTRARVPAWNEPVNLGAMKEVIRYKYGWKSLRGYIEAVELERRTTIIKRKRNRHRTRYTITLAALARFAPELVPEDILQGRGGTPNDKKVLSALTEMKVKQERRMEEIARDVFVGRMKPYARRIHTLEVEAKTKKTTSPPNATESHG